jgi:hypothetical protein
LFLLRLLVGRLWIAVAALLMSGFGMAEVREIPSPAGPGSGQPNLVAAPDGRMYLSWLERRGNAEVALRFASRLGGGWSAPRTIAAGSNWFVNWADFPSLAVLPDGSLAAHWLAKNGDGAYAYDVQLSQSFDGGASWSAPRVPHRDGTGTEHGFVSLFPAGDRMLGAAWLDGRETAAGAGHGEHGGGAMTLRYAAIGRDGSLRGEAVLDARTCDCCQTAAATTAEGPVVVFRDRSPEEVRDIAIVRLRGGAWSKPRPVAVDGWKIHGCPVNGPSIAAEGRRVAVAWFTLANERPRVKLAFSGDAGATFGPAVVVDDGQPLGRVDTLLLDDGSALVSWVAQAGEANTLKVRRVRGDGSLAPAVTVGPAADVRANAFPQMARAGDTVMIAWTGERVRTAALVPIP